MGILLRAEGLVLLLQLLGRQLPAWLVKLAGILPEPSPGHKQFGMPLVCFPLVAFGRAAHDPVEDPKLVARSPQPALGLAFEVGENAALELVEGLLSAYCEEVVAVDHKRDCQLHMVEDARARRAAHEAQLLEDFLVGALPALGRVAGAIHALDQAPDDIATVPGLCGKLDVHFSLNVRVEVCPGDVHEADLQQRVISREAQYQPQRLQRRSRGVKLLGLVRLDLLAHEPATDLGVYPIPCYS